MRRNVAIHYFECLKLLRWPLFSVEKKDPILFGIPERIPDNQPKMLSNEIVDWVAETKVPVAPEVGVSVNEVAVVGATVVGVKVVGATVVGISVDGAVVVGVTVIEGSVVGVSVDGAVEVGIAVVGATVEGVSVDGVAVGADSTPAEIA